MINPKILILPDIHGRAFYQKALSEAIDKGGGNRLPWRLPGSVSR